MRSAVIQRWHEFSEPLEGRVHSMYLDVIQLVTTGVGNLIDASRGGGPSPWTPALSLPWKHADGRAATHGEIRDAWLALKAQPKLAKMHWKYAAKLNDLRLSDADIDTLVENVLYKNERALKLAFPRWDEWPADAQLGALSMSWAVGTGFPGIFKNFTKYVNADDWVAARVACKIRETARGPNGETVPNPGTIPRNRANELCFDNAATVVSFDMDREVLHWPNVARPEPKKPEESASVHPVLIPLEPDWDELRKARDAAVTGNDDDEGNSVA